MNLIVTTVFFASCIIAVANCGEYHTIAGFTYYTSYPDRKNWDQAKHDCMSTGTVLVDVLSQAENDRIISIIKQVESKYTLGFVDWWTSGTEDGSTNTFCWDTTKAALLYENWEIGAPSITPGIGNCLHFNRIPSHKWSAIDCGSMFYYVCRGTPNTTPATPATPATLATTVAPRSNDASSVVHSITGMTKTVWVFGMFYIVTRFF